MKTPQLLFALLILMAVAVAALWSIEPTTDGHAVNHPQLPVGTMQQAPDGQAQPRALYWWATCFGAAVAMFTVATMSLGLCGQQRHGRAAWILIAVGGVYAGILIAVVVLYLTYLGQQEPTWWGFPISTAWMLFIFGPAPLFLVACYSAMFPRWILTPQDMETFQRLVASRRRESGE